MPKGLDLLPSMRAPRYTPRLGKHADISGGGAAGDEAPAKAIEYVPWVVESGSSGRIKAGHTGGGTAAPMPAAGGANDRVQWFPRGLPKEASGSGAGQDERESALFNTRASMAIDRLGEQVEETTKRQEEMEIRRREKVMGHDRMTGKPRCVCRLDLWSFLLFGDTVQPCLVWF